MTAFFQRIVQGTVGAALRSISFPRCRVTDDRLPVNRATAGVARASAASPAAAGLSARGRRSAPEQWDSWEDSWGRAEASVTFTSAPKRGLTFSFGGLPITLNAATGKPNDAGAGNVSDHGPEERLGRDGG